MCDSVFVFMDSRAHRVKQKNKKTKKKREKKGPPAQKMVSVSEVRRLNSTRTPPPLPPPVFILGFYLSLWGYEKKTTSAKRLVYKTLQKNKIKMNYVDCLV